MSRKNSVKRKKKKNSMTHVKTWLRKALFKVVQVISKGIGTTMMKYCSGGKKLGSTPNTAWASVNL